MKMINNYQVACGLVVLLISSLILVTLLLVPSTKVDVILRVQAGRGSEGAGPVGGDRRAKRGRA